jgi:hypothetical protein
MAFFEKTQITDSNDNVTNVASEDSIVFLRRIAKILENQQAVDPQQRQRITLDSITAGVTLPAVTTVTTVTTVATVSAVTNIAGLFSWNQQILADPARTAYNTGIRSALTFS